MRPTTLRVGGIRHLLPVALCALGGHVALYRSIRPASGHHAYFAWYEPLVAGLSLAAVVVFGGLVLTVLLGRHRARSAALGFLLPATTQADTTTRRATRLALASLAFLLVQESLERSLAAERLMVAELRPVEILTVLVVLAGLAALLALAGRSCSQLIEFVARRVATSHRRETSVRYSRLRPTIGRRRNPLADLQGQRAPPLTA